MIPLLCELIHPDTLPTELTGLLYSHFKLRYEEQHEKLYSLFTDHGISDGYIQGQIAGWDEFGDPICILYLTLPEKDEVLFKLSYDEPMPIYKPYVAKITSENSVKLHQTRKMLLKELNW